jgi:hypothetical protein
METFCTVYGLKLGVGVGMCANKVATAYHLIGTAVRGYVAQSTGRIGLSNKKRATAWVLNESTYEKSYGAHSYPIQ